MSLMTDYEKHVKSLEQRTNAAEISLLQLRNEYNWLVDMLEYATDQITSSGGRLPYGWKIPEKR